MKKDFFLRVAAAAVIGSTLGACVPVLVGGAAVTTGVVAVNRRTTGIQVEDKRIGLAAENSAGNATGDAGHINVTSFNRIVLMTGEVPTEQGRASAGKAVEQTENVRKVFNELAVMPNSSMTQRSNDTYITSRVKAALASDEVVSALDVKVVTERSVVYLMGIVTERESNRSANIARAVSGVEKVVRVFETMSDADIEKLEISNKKEEAKPAGDESAASIDGS